MTLLIIYVVIALGFSFLCSIAEAVLLSVTTGYIAVKESKNKPSGPLLRKLKEDINKPLAAILTLNTIAHTVGAAGAGAQATAVFGDAYLGIISAVLTLLILVFSEIIPKTIGAHYWKSLAPFTAFCLKYLIYSLYPFVKMSEYMTRSLTHGPSLKGFNRAEFSAMAEVSQQDGLLNQQESSILMNLLSLHTLKAGDAMTPQSVMFAADNSMTVGEYIEAHASERFSRIPLYSEDKNNIDGFVLLIDILQASALGEDSKALDNYKRDMPAVTSELSLSRAFDLLLHERAKITLVVDEYGGVQGLLTIEDVLETILGLEIIDEVDKSVDMQELARRFWQRRAREKGVAELEAETDTGKP